MSDAETAHASQPQRPSPSASSTFSTQSSNQRSARRAEASAATLSASGLRHKPSKSTRNEDDWDHATATTAGPEALHSMLEVRSSKTRHLAVAACMMDLFNTINTPRPSDIGIDKIRAYWKQYQESVGLPVLSDKAVQFKFTWPLNGMPDREWNVFEDVSLRLAYRLWLSRDDVYEPFVLLLRDEVLEE